jgi:hypothetical protein
MKICGAPAACLIVAALLLSADAEATGLRNITFEQQVAEADVVVVARAWHSGRAGRPRLDSTGQLELTRMRVLRVLKGNPALETLDLVTRGSVAEHVPNCCTPRRRYILMLRQGRDNMFEVVNGRHSVILVP